MLIETERQAQHITEEAHRLAEKQAHEVLEAHSHHRAEAERMAVLQQEMRAGYRAFLLTALELLEQRSPPTGDTRATDHAEPTGPDGAASRRGELHEPLAETAQESQPVGVRVA